MYGALKPILFRLDPERAHHLATGMLARLNGAPGLLGPPKPEPRLAVEAAGLRLPAPLGIAAGFDKTAECYNALLALGFSHAEVGTVTPRPQPGNDPPRLQRLPELEALVNRLGFPGPGLDAVARRLGAHPPRGVVGANIGPNKGTPPEEVPAALAGMAAALAPLCSYLAINVSSPNTPGLRALQEPEAVSRLVRAVLDAAADAGHRRPVMLKLHPDAPDAELGEVARAARDAGAAAILATNTTRARPPGSEGAIEGGLSGAPLRERARNAIAALHKALGRDTPIIGVGGILTGADAVGHMRAGASAVQAYTGFVYRGPGFARKVHAEMLLEMDRLGVDKAGELVGQAA